MQARRARGGYVVFGAWVATILFAILMKPSASGHGTHTQLGLPPCPTPLLFHRPCPGCGLTTSWTATIHGNLPLAFSAHPLGPLLLLGFTIWAFAALRGAILGKIVRLDSKLANRCLAAGLILFLGFGAIRFALDSNYSGPTEAGVWAKANR